MQASLRITVPLTNDEWKTLKAVAEREKREPRMQASYLINRALLEMTEPVKTATLPEQTANGFPINQPT